MHTILVGCDYSATSSLSYHITKWARSTIGGLHWFHDHWKIPHVNHPPYVGKEATIKEHDEMFEAWISGNGEDPSELGFTEDEQQLFMALTPNQKEMFQRYHMEYHVGPEFYTLPDHNIVGMHIDEAVYAELYYQYGNDKDDINRKFLTKHIEGEILKQAPHTVLVLLKCDAKVIRDRMQTKPHKYGLLQDKDVEFVLERFEEEYERSLITNKFIIDTSKSTPEQCLKEFVSKFEPYITDADRVRILVNSAKQNNKWI